MAYKSYFKGTTTSSGGTSTPHIPNTVHNTPGCCGSSMPQMPISGPENPGPPESMRKALAKKNNDGKGPGAPNKSTTMAGSVR